MAESPSLSPEDGSFPIGFDTKPPWPWVVQFSGACKTTQTLVSPLDGSSHEADIPEARGKRCIGRDGDWSLMFDELTGECFLMSFRSSPKVVVPLPPLRNPPEPDRRFGCALSTQAPPEDCTVVLGVRRDKSLRYCRPGDKEWSELPVDLGKEADFFDGAITSGGGNGKKKIYATTMRSLVVVDASCSAAPPRVERSGIKLPSPRPGDHAYNYEDYLVESCGDVFFVRSYLFGVPGEVVNLDAHRWDPSTDAWETVESIGDTTFFLGRNSLATRAGTTEPNCIYILRPACDGVGIYTISLQDMIIMLNILDPCDEEHKHQVFWALPASSSIEQEGPSSEWIQRSTKEKGQEAAVTNVVPHTWLGSSGEWKPWSDLHIDVVELLVPKISVIDYLRLRAVCKHWSSISKPIQDAKVLPLLMTTRPGRKDSLDVFDPVSQKKYRIDLNIPDEDDTGSQILRFTKNGWIILSRGTSSFYMVNPLKRSLNDVIAIPPVDSYGYRGISFSSVPGSPDFVVITVHVFTNGRFVNVNTWRVGDGEWTEQVFENDISFLMATHNPVFFEGQFCCLDINGRLGVFNPETSGWSVLEEPPPIHDAENMLQRECNYSYLVEWRGDLIAIFREDGAEEGAMEIFRLDRSRVVWSELDGLEDAVVFWDRKNAIVRPTTPGSGEDLCNKMFLPSYTETGGNRVPTFYSLETQQYYPSFHGQEEPINALWFEPNFDYLK